MECRLYRRDHQLGLAGLAPVIAARSYIFGEKVIWKCANLQLFLLLFYGLALV